MNSSNNALKPAPIVIINVEEAVERMGDKDIYLEIARYFASHLPSSLAKLDACLRAGKLDEATRAAHSLKGNCATVGADALKEDCLQLETLCQTGDHDRASAIYAELAPKLVALGEKLNSL